jgi:hypothetical protein
MNKKLILAMLAAIILISLTDAAVKGIEITNVGPTTNLIAGKEYTFTVTFKCLKEGSGSQPTINPTLHFIDGTTTKDTTCPPCNCECEDCESSCSCTTTNTITPLIGNLETKTIRFALEAGGYSTGYKPITVYASKDEAVLKSGCGTLASGVKAIGRHCWEYDEGPYNSWDNNKFDCVAPGFQVNIGKRCVVNCIETSKKACKCSAVAPCIDQCLEGTLLGYCTEVSNFDCSTSPEYNCAIASTKPTAYCDNTNTCKVACAQGCGRETVFGTKCDENCNTVTCNKAKYLQDEKDNCKGACVSMCKVNEEMCNLLFIMEIAAALIAAIMLAINGLKWVMSESPEARDSARGGVYYVIVGIIVIMAALGLVSTILGVSLICFFI